MVDCVITYKTHLLLEGGPLSKKKMQQGMVKIGWVLSSDQTVFES